MPVLEREKHVEYILSLDKKSDELDYWFAAHLRLNGIYWASTALALLNKNVLDRQKVIDNVMKCYHPLKGGFGGHVDHDPHLLFTLSAIQILIMFDAIDQIDSSKVMEFIKSLENKDGSFAGDEYGEVDTRFSYCAISCASLLKKLNEIDTQKATEYLITCQNFDGGFGSVPGAESHAGQSIFNSLVFCCVGALAILDSLHLVDVDELGWWLAERQLPNGGLNGRPEKLEDVCYSWWVLSSLEMIGRKHWINGEKLIEFILEAQDLDIGGIADRPGDMVDVFHTLFGICGLSMLGYPDLEPVDPRYCMPLKTIQNHFEINF